MQVRPALSMVQCRLQTSQVVQKHDTGVSGGLEKSTGIMAKNYWQQTVPK